MEQFIQQTLQPLFVALITALIPVLVAVAVRFIHTKTGIHISDALAAKAESAALQAVLAVEEKGAARAAQQLSAWPPAQKHAAAISMILSAVPSVTPDEANNLVLAALAKVPGLGASGNLGVAGSADTKISVV